MAPATGVGGEEAGVQRERWIRNVCSEIRVPSTALFFRKSIGLVAEGTLNFLNVVA